VAPEVGEVGVERNLDARALDGAHGSARNLREPLFGLAFSVVEFNVFADAVVLLFAVAASISCDPRIRSAAEPEIRAFGESLPIGLASHGQVFALALS